MDGSRICASGAVERVPPPRQQVDITPLGHILRNDNLYFERMFDKIAYILSEFLDNSLQAAIHHPLLSAFRLSQHCIHLRR